MTLEQRLLYEEYLDLISFGGGVELAPGYTFKLFEDFSRASPDELRLRIEETRPYAAKDRRDWERARAEAERAQQYPGLITPWDEYPRTDNTYERTICADKDPQFEKFGMPLYSINDSVDPALKIFGGVHVGDADAWIPVLLRDGYCDGRYAYVYAIDTAPVYLGRKPFYEAEDFHVGDRTATPESLIIFSRREKIPPRLIQLVEVVDLVDIDPAPDPH